MKPLMPQDFEDIPVPAGMTKTPYRGKAANSGCQTPKTDADVNPIPKDLRWLDGLDNELISRILSSDAKVAKLQAEVEQLKKGR